MKTETLQHSFVRFIPDDLEEGMLYVSVDYCTATHTCACGCGSKVVTPLTPTDWELTFNGETVSLYPSIGNWNFNCKSHYWIKRGRVEWAGQWSKEEIAKNRNRDLANKMKRHQQADESHIAKNQASVEPEPVKSFWRKLLQKLWL